MFQETAYTQEQNLIAGQATQMSKKFDDFYFLGETKKKQYPSAFWQEISQVGYFGILADPEYGGTGMNAADLVVFLYSMAKAGLASYQLINQILCSDILSRMGSDKQREGYLPGLISGDFWCYADMENAQGRSLFDIASTAQLQGDHYVLNGGKSYAVCASIASHLIIAARTEELDEKNPEAGLSLFVVDAKSPGITCKSEHLTVRVTGNREEMAATGDLFDSIEFADVKIPVAGLIGAAGQAGGLIKSIASRQLLMVGLMGAGWGDKLLEKSIAYANERVIFKDSISTYQAVQHPMVKAKIEVEMAKLLIERAAEAIDGGEDTDAILTYCSVAKCRGTEAAYAACDIAMQTHGGSGYDRDTGIISIWPLILMSRLVPLNNGRILGRFSENVLGLPTDNDSSPSPQPLLFEPRTEREVKLIGLIQGAIAKQQESPGSTDIATVMKDMMAGELAEYQDMLWSEGQGAIPIKLDIFRQFSVHRDGDVTAGEGIAKSIVKRSPAKFGLSAMAMAAVSAGEGGREKVMNEYLPKMMEGKLFCYCITEPGAGTNTHNVSTIAVDEGDHYRLNGQKTFISAANSAYFMAVIARVEVDGKKNAVGTFVMEANTPGISMTELDIAALGEPQFTVYFDNVILPKDALVGAKSKKAGAGKGISESVFYTLNLERVMVALMSMMVGRESLERAIKKAREPQAFGPRLGAAEDIKQKIAELKLNQELTNLALKKAAVAFDNKSAGKHVGLYANMAKYLSSTFAHDSADLALKLYGVAGLDKDLDDIGGLYQIGRVLRTAPINNEMVFNFLAENLMGLPKSYRV